MELPEVGVEDCIEAPELQDEHRAAGSEDELGHVEEEVAEPVAE